MLPQEQVDALSKQANGAEFTVDLERMEITAPNDSITPFELDPIRRHNMLNGLDDIALTLQRIDKIKAFESKQKVQQPWLYN